MAHVLFDAIRFLLDLRSVIIRIVGRLSFIARFGLIQMQIDGDELLIFSHIKMKPRVVTGRHFSAKTVLAGGSIVDGHVPGFAQDRIDIIAESVGYVDFHGI